MEKRLTRNRNAIRNTLVVFTEAFEKIDITERELIIQNKIAFVHFFSNVDDFRDATKIEYVLSNILLMIFFSILREGKASCLSIAQHIQFFKDEYEALGLIEDGKTPSHDTIRRILMGLDSKSLIKETIQKLEEFLASIEDKRSKLYAHKSLDGKTVNGSGRGKDTKNPSRNINVLNLYNNSTAICFNSIAVGSKTNEIPIGQEELNLLNLRKTVVTFDALHTQRDTCSIINGAKGIYVAPVKQNQEGLYNEIQAKIEKYQSKGKLIHRETDNREFDFVILPGNYETDGFDGMKVMVRMISKVRKNPLVMYFISNTKDFELIEEAIDARWEIEDDLHKLKDEIFNEDKVTYTSREAVVNIAILGNLAVAFMRIYQGVTNSSLAYAKKVATYKPFDMMNVVLNLMDSKETIKELKKEFKKIRSSISID